MEAPNGDTAAADSQSLSDIQNYLANFNKEISNPEGQNFILTESGETKPAAAGSASQSHAGVYTVQEDGDATVVAASGLPQDQKVAQVRVAAGMEDGNGQLMTVQDSRQGVATVQSNQSELITVPGVPRSQQPATSSGEDVVVNTGNSYQTVTIVPSDVNQGGEVGYVLIVSPMDGEQKADLSVYDFKEDARALEDEEEDEESDDGSPRKVKVITKKAGQQTVQTQLMCNYCNYTSPKRYLLTRHMKTHSEERPHKCQICDRGFKTVASLQNHINTHTGVKPHKCKECDSAFTTSGELVRHVRYRHTFEKPHKCALCDYASVELSKLKRHVRSHTGERPYQCPTCSYASPDTYKLKRHLRIHTGEKPYECDICHARFTQSNSLKAHKLIHTGNKPVFQCELCPTTCGRKTDLKIHVQKLHTSDKPLQCKKCGKSFPDRYTYKIHLKTHEGEKCFRCELCPYAALSQRHLESHILTHTGEKPFSCEYCDQSFRQKQLLKRHKNLYHNPDYVATPPKEKVHECAVCSKAFAHRGNLLRHLAAHYPDNPEYQINEDDMDEDLSMGEEDETDEESDGEGAPGREEVIQGATAIVDGQEVQVQLVGLPGGTSSIVYQPIAGATNQNVQIQQEEEVEEIDEDDMEGIEEEYEEVEAVEQPMKKEKEEVVVKIEDAKKGRGRPPSNPTPVSTPVLETRVTRKRLIEQTSPEEKEPEMDPPAKSTRRSSGGKLAASPVKRESPRKKKEGATDEQKKKDIETCFGFEAEEGEGQFVSN